MTAPITVLQLNTIIRDLFDLDPRLQDVLIEGEISNFTRASSGHLYFTLKDDRSELKCVMWRSQAARLSFNPQHGDSVLAHGKVEVYEQRGQYQLYCDSLRPAGIGELNRQFELLKAKLQSEGLFDSERKRPIPAFPRRIGIVTSPTTAAFQDIQNVIRRRFPMLEVVLSPTPVQGNDAAPQIIAALDRLNARTDIDLIVMTRGGGSLEDLWCFNDEELARAVAASRLPVVTGVGHEIDFTLVDFAADHRAPTPSAAAELVTPDGAVIKLNIDTLRAQLTQSIQATIDEGRAELDDSQRWLRRISPAHRLQTSRQRIDDLSLRTQNASRNKLERQRERLAAQTRALMNASPQILLQRGYAMVHRTTDGSRVTRISDVKPDELISIDLYDGHLTATVRDRQENA